MLRSLMQMDISSIIITVLAVILSLSIHEMAHGLASLWFGDKTAKNMGRLSLNPLAHIDWMGLLCLLLFGFGWAKPVPVDPSSYKDPKLGMIWTAFAGPLANFLLSFVCVFFFCLLALYSGSFPATSAGNFLISLLSTTAALSAGFGLFNLIPVPPLDGAKIFTAFLPDREYFQFNRGSKWTTLIFLVLVWSGLISQPLTFLRTGMLSIFQQACLWLLTL